MRELTKSMLRVSWALPLFGIKQVMNFSLPTRANQEKVRHAFDAVSAAAQDEMGNLSGLHQAGDQLGRGMVDAAFNLVTLEAFNPASWIPACGGNPEAEPASGQAPKWEPMPPA